MSFPGFPSYPPPWGPVAADPGPIPLRPLSAGDLLGAGFGVVRRHLALLGPVSVLIGVLSSAVSLGILAGTGSLTEYASGRWLDDVMNGATTSVPVPMLVAATLGTVVSVVGTIVVSGLAAACAGVDAMGRQSVPGALRERLAGRLPSLLLTSVLVGIAISIGLALVVVPGVLIYLAWALAAPAAAMERATPGTALRRSVRLTVGHRSRILGMTLLIGVIAFGIDVVVTSVIQAAAASMTAVAALVLSQAISAVLAALTTSWIGAVIALLYIDIRVRAENLGPALRAFAAADRTRPTGGPALGSA
ncbi:MAG TPA: hypothetical protein VFM01_19130 [Nakamurella sp.]|nr:hypothetical protein [Nakamurella sp.]